MEAQARAGKSVRQILRLQAAQRPAPSYLAISVQPQVLMRFRHRDGLFQRRRPRAPSMFRGGHPRARRHRGRRRARR
jgi:hypothetical protein